MEVIGEMTHFCVLSECRKLCVQKPQIREAQFFGRETYGPHLTHLTENLTLSFKSSTFKISGKKSSHPFLVQEIKMQLDSWV